MRNFLLWFFSFMQKVHEQYLLHSRHVFFLSLLLLWRRSSDWRRPFVLARLGLSGSICKGLVSKMAVDLYILWYYCSNENILKFKWTVSEQNKWFVASGKLHAIEGWSAASGCTDTLTTQWNGRSSQQLSIKVRNLFQHLWCLSRILNCVAVYLRNNGGPDGSLDKLWVL